jgi:hypothetical protein
MTGALLSASVTGGARAAEKVRITQLSDVAFGQIVTVADLSVSQNVCVHSTSSGGGYSVVADGSGAGGSFSLASGIDNMAYQVQWAETSGQTNGVSLQAGTASQIFYSSATHQFCNNGPPSSASLIVTLVGNATANARAGNYTGTLSITIVPE